MSHLNQEKITIYLVPGKGYHDTCGGYVEYLKGGSVPWGFMINFGSYHDACGDIMNTPRGTHNIFSCAS